MDQDQNDNDDEVVLARENGVHDHDDGGIEIKPLRTKETVNNEDGSSPSSSRRSSLDGARHEHEDDASTLVGTPADGILGNGTARLSRMDLHGGDDAHGDDVFAEEGMSRGVSGRARPEGGLQAKSGVIIVSRSSHRYFYVSPSRQMTSSES